MNKNKKYDLLDEIKNFPKVKTSDDFMKNLRIKIDEELEREKALTVAKKKSRLKNFIDSFFKKRFLIPVIGAALVSTAIIILYFGTDEDREEVQKVIPQEVKDMDMKLKAFDKERLETLKVKIDSLNQDLRD